MYSVTLKWIDTNNLKWFVFELATSKLVESRLAVVSKKGTFDYYNHVATVFENVIWPKYQHGNVSFVMLIHPEPITLFGEDNTAIKHVEDYFDKYGITNVRFVHTQFFDGTMSLLHFKNEKKSHTPCVMVCSIVNGPVQTPETMYALRKGPKGWRSSRLTWLENNPTPTPADATVCVVQTHLKKKKMRLPPVFDRPHDFYLDFPINATENAIIYLSRIYTNLTTDYSCYVPVCHQRNYGYVFEGQKQKCYSSHEDELPCVFEHKMRFPNAPRGSVLTIKEYWSTIAVMKTDDFKSSKEIKLPNNCDSLTIVSGINKNGRPGMLVKYLKKNKTVDEVSQNKALVLSSLPQVTVEKEYIRINYWDNGIFKNLVDVNGLSSIPLKISFFGKVPIVGSAVTDKVKPVRHNIHNLFDKKYIIQKIQEGATDLVLDEKENVQVIVETLQGLRRVTPFTILAVMIKSILKLLSKTNESQKMFNLRFDGVPCPIDDGDELEKLVKCSVYLGE